MFKFHLKPDTQARLAAERREIQRLYRLTDPWLAAALLRLARDARKLAPYRPDDPIYDARLVWGLVPELARRLGTVRLEAQEIDWAMRRLSDYELRVTAGLCLANTAGQDTRAWSLLTRLPVHGNPVAIAADRLVPGAPDDRDDPIARQLAEVATLRGIRYEGLWTPEAFLPDE